MRQDQNFNTLLHKLLCTNRNSQHEALKDIAIYMPYADKADIRKLLNVLNVTDDIELQVKLFSILAAYLISNCTYTDIIITCSYVYDKVECILSKNLPMKTAKVLNFISALLHNDEVDKLSRKKILVVYAQNMIRVSGCLATMYNLFTSCMMYHDTWKALCRCLAEILRHSKLNQSYCTHLVPVCVYKCRQGNIDVYVVLECLLHKHEHNVTIFLENDGMSIFTDEMLQNEACIQLLNTVTQNTTVMYRIPETNIRKSLQELLLFCGPYSRIGQWATIILYRINSQRKAPNLELNDENGTQHISQNINKPSDTALTKGISENNNTTNFLKTVFNECFNPNLNMKDISMEKLGRKDNLYANGKTLFSKKRTENFWKHISDIVPNDKKLTKTDKSLRNSYLKQEPYNFHSFLMSNMQKGNRRKKDINVPYQRTFINKYSPLHTNIKDNVMMRDTIINGQINKTNFYNSSILTDTKYENNSIDDMTNFKPVFVSTPKSNRQNRVNDKKISQFLNKSNYFKKKSPSTLKKKKINVSCIYKHIKDNELIPDKDNKNQSMSARLFNVINDSCTTLVKTVKNIFKFKPKSNSPKISIKSNVTFTCENSFTNYMRKRDDILPNNNTNKENVGFLDFSTEINHSSCKTCNDTLFLKQKLHNDVFLKQTVKKLKLGINLYGCNFKKISKMLWPRETYMTPNVLYNLYRKLLEK